MAKNQNKTNATNKSVDDFLKSLDDEQQVKDSYQLIELMQEVTGEPPVMWGDSIIGFGKYHYTYDSGREGDFMWTGFAPRKGKMSIYLMSGFSHFQELLVELGKHKTSKACLYVKRLSDIHLDVLKIMITESVKHIRNKYPDA